MDGLDAVRRYKYIVRGTKSACYKKLTHSLSLIRASEQHERGILYICTRTRYYVLVPTCQPVFARSMPLKASVCAAPISRLTRAACAHAKAAQMPSRFGECAAPRASPPQASVLDEMFGGPASSAGGGSAQSAARQTGATRNLLARTRDRVKTSGVSTGGRRSGGVLRTGMRAVALRSRGCLDS